MELPFKQSKDGSNAQLYHSENGMFAHFRQCPVILHRSCTQRTREHPQRVLHCTWCSSGTLQTRDGHLMGL